MPPVPSLCDGPAPGSHGEGLSEAGEGVVVELSMEQKKCLFMVTYFGLKRLRAA
jgi:hypothetical protein